eukprot:COSAG06_NODE_2930_length_6075_cov_6.587684_1_plen_87_part_00
MWSRIHSVITPNTVVQQHGAGGLVTMAEALGAVAFTSDIFTEYLEEGASNDQSEYTGGEAWYMNDGHEKLGVPEGGGPSTGSIGRV